MPPSAARSRPSRALCAPVKAPLRWPNSADMAPSPRRVAQFTSTKRPATWCLARLSSYTRRARKDLPAPVGPISSIGARERTATRSICSMLRLNAGLRVAMPDFSSSSPSSCSRWKREAMRS